MPKEAFAEKRKFVRFLISIPLKYAKVGIKQIASVVTRDISAEGLGLITAEEVPVNAPLSVCLTIPDNGEEIPLDAQVCWTRKDGQGQYHSGLKLKRSRIKPIPLVLRTVSSRL